MEGEEEDRLDDEDLAVLKEENKNEHELQIALAEIFGTLFKTHKEFCRELVQKLWQEVLPAAAKHGTKHTMKFVYSCLNFRGLGSESGVRVRRGRRTEIC